MTINIEEMVECTLKEPDDFLKIRETLTRIGVASRKDKTLYQSCHILHKQGRYFIVHFKELSFMTSLESFIAFIKSNGPIIFLYHIKVFCQVASKPFFY